MQVAMLSCCVGAERPIQPALFLRMRASVASTGRKQTKIRHFTRLTLWAPEGLCPWRYSRLVCLRSSVMTAQATVAAACP
jgi:hypothetical protein